ncbi:phosphatase PAP2 family protein [Prosthecobacter vanneervenii]|uniref:Membrane-associated phospholipid phosphatase n=1 Tax=Prosthecobacter vanneervenii TaxID=48466 RepID=A0A7W7YAI3_9BACT|nr:phosphatase PAP2 family protein [Prosthecobacter vanneervenii]MBB5032626.1 membrane-associated phospholipid phosphatase [Prosthecobacter vanneervenii]
MNDKHGLLPPYAASWNELATEDAAAWLPAGLDHRARPMLACWWADVLCLCRSAWAMLRANRLKLLCFMTAGAALVCWLMPQDLALLARLRWAEDAPDNAAIHGLARWLSYWGDLAGFNMFVFVTLTCFAFVRRSSFFRRLVLAAVVGTVLTGGVANLVRVSTGRARPGSNVPAGFYGPTLSARKQSFPSAHTATSFGACVPLAVAFPPAGVPLLAVSGGVAWSRLQNNCHHPSDVLTSVLLACVFGVPLGLTVRRMRRAAASV